MVKNTGGLKTHYKAREIFDLADGCVAEMKAASSPKAVNIKVWV